MRIQLIRYGKNIAGKDRIMVTLQGWIVGVTVAWILGMIFMPKINLNKKNRLLGNWYSNTRTEKIAIQVKQNDYFYFDVIPNSGSAKQYKGMVNEKMTDTISFVSFNNDTLLFHQIVELGDKKMTLKDLKDSTILIFEK